MQVPAKILTQCSGTFPACRTKAASGAVSDEEVEPWGVQDSEGWSQRRTAGNATFYAASEPSASGTKETKDRYQGAAEDNSSGSGGRAGGQASASRNGTTVKCPDTDPHGGNIRAMSHMLPGVGLLMVNESDVVRASPIFCSFLSEMGAGMLTVMILRLAISKGLLKDSLLIVGSRPD